MSKENNPFLNLFQTVIDSLETHKIPYVLVGGTVMPFYGNIRSTQVIDIMLLLDEIGEPKLRRWSMDLESNGLMLSVDEIINAMNENIHANIFEPMTFAFRIDLKKINTPLDRLTFKHKKRVVINDRDVWIISPESQIGVKLSPGFRSDTDIEDVIAIIETMDLDLQLLSRFLSTINSFNYFCDLLSTVKTERTSALSNSMDC